jgi:hypothetical protein
MAELPDGRIVVRDGQGGRLTAFAGSGSGTPLYTANAPGLVINPDYLSVTPGGTLYLVTTIRGEGSPRPPAREVFVRLRADGSVIDTIEYPRLAAAGAPQLTVMRNSGGYTSQFAIGLPYFPVTQSLLSPLGYLVTVNTERYAIDLRMPATPPLASADPPPVWKAGDRVVSLRRSIQPVPVPEAERTEFRSRIEERMREYQAGWQWNGPQVPRVKPPLKGIAMGLDGRIWAQLSTVSERFVPEAGSGRPPATWRESGSLFDVLEPDGTYIGQVAVSEGTRILARRGEHVWGVTRDTNDVPTLHRFRITWR